MEYLLWYDIALIIQSCISIKMMMMMIIIPLNSVYGANVSKANQTTVKQILSNRIRVRIWTGNRQTIWLFTSMALGLLRKNPVGRYLSSGPASIHLLARVLQAANSVSCKHVVFMLLLAICVLYWSLWRIVKSCKNNFFYSILFKWWPSFFL